MARPAQPLKTRFWRFVLKTEKCWEWTGATDKDGYGKFQVPASLSWDGRHHTARAHRAALFLATGEWPDEAIQIQHSCDNPTCVRPGHIKPGTASKNCADMRKRGRGPEQRGTWNGGCKNPENARLAKLTWAKVIEIRRKYADGNKSKVAIAREFRVSDCTIRDIVKGRTWKG